MKKITTEAIRSIPLGGVCNFQANNGREARRAQSLCSYWRQVEGAQIGVTLSTKHDKVNGIITVSKIRV